MPWLVNKHIARPMKTVFIVTSSIQRANILFSSKLLPSLKQTGERVIIFTSGELREKIEKKHPTERVTFERLEPAPRNAYVSLLSRARASLLRVDDKVIDRAIRTMRSASAKHLIKNTLKEHLGKILRKIIRAVVPLKLFYFLFNRAEEKLFRNDTYDALFKKYGPSAVILGTLGSETDDVIFMAHARRHKVPVAIMDLPWNYLDDRLPAYPRPADIIFTWNEWMKNILRQRFRVDEPRIVVNGSVRYDFLSGAKFPEPNSRNKFLSDNGIDPNKKLVLFAIGSDDWHPFQIDVIKFIVEEAFQTRAPDSCQLLVRIGPRHKDKAKYHELAKTRKNLIVEEADKKPDQDYLTRLMSESDLVLSIFSSLAIDASLLDKPMIYIGFTAKDKEPYDDVLKEIFEFETIREAVRLGEINVAYGKEQFIRQFNRCLDDPQSGQEGRKKLIDFFLGKNRGLGGQIIAREVIRFLE